MKKKIYYIIYSAIQIIVGCYTCFYASTIAQKQFSQMEKLLEQFPESIKNSYMSLISVDALTSSFRLMSILAVVLAIIFLIITLRNRIAYNKVLCIISLAISMFILNDIILILALIALVLVANTKKEVMNKQNKKVTKLSNIKCTNKDYFLAILLGIVYFSQFGFAYLFNNVKVNYLVVDIVFNIITFVFSIFVFRKILCRDFLELKNNFGGYVKFVLKHWGLMYLIILFIGFIRIFLGVNLETANQQALSNFSLWYLLPVTIIWAPIVEELIFRGVFRRFIKNDKLFILTTGLVFGLLHTITSEVGIFNIIIQGLPYIAMGSMLGYIYVKTNNIYSNIMLHFFQNTLSVLLMILI